MATKLSGDFEFASVASLPRVGAHKYARDPSTRILCFAYAIDDDEPVIWFPTLQAPPPYLISAALDPELEFHAWNAAFEFAIWNACGRRYGLPPLPLERFHCTMARGLYWGVPPKLEQAAIVLRTNVEKDAEGAKLMRKMTKPRPHKNGASTWWDQDEPALLVRLGEYCLQDVRTEMSVAQRLRPMPKEERRLWLLDQRMNGRGLGVDVGAVRDMQAVVDSEVIRIGASLSDLTDGVITAPSQTARLLGYLQGEGVKIDSLDKRTLPIVLKEPLSDRHCEILTLYQQGAKSSTAKLRSMMGFLDDDNRIRGLVQYGGAMRTLRWAGRGPQIQNYPRPTKAINARIALADMAWGADAETIDFAHGNPMDVVSQCLRGAYVPAEGRAFAVCDYSAIEARVVAWLAGQEDALDVFRRGLDIYVKAARDVQSSSRDLGKLLVLSCGFGAGPKRVRVIAQNPPYFIDLTEQEAFDNVHGWRKANHKIRSLWYNVDDIVRMVINEKVSDRWVWTDSKRIAFRMATDARLDGAMLMKLPSGRLIVYRDALVENIINDPDGAAEAEDVIRYGGLDMAKKWVRIRSWGGKFVENMTQAVARDLLADALLQLDDESDDLLTTVHDEIIAEPLQEAAEGRLREMKAVMGTPPSWASDLPLKAEGGVMARYGK